MVNRFLIPIPLELIHTIKEATSERGNEHIYIYTVEVKFFNGTTVEIPAGYSAFNTIGPDTQDDAPEVMTFQANFTEISRASINTATNARNLSLNINITFPHGRTLEQGEIVAEDKGLVFLFTWDVI